MFKEIKLKSTGRDFVVVEDYTYNGIVVPKGTTSNGATLTPLFYVIIGVSLIFPLFIWVLPLFLFLLRTSFHPRHITASVVHDYITTEMEEYKLADEIFESLLVESGETAIRIKLKVYGVRSWHKAAYKENNKPKKWFYYFLKLYPKKD